MWKFAGKFEYTCSTDGCEGHGHLDIDDFEIESGGGSERNMGPENVFELLYQISCDECCEPILISFEVYEYPSETLNYIQRNFEGAEVEGSPYFEYLEDIYEEEDLSFLSKSISDIVYILQQYPERLYELTPREFEEVIAEIFRKKGFEVALTKQTRDGGKDIIAIQTDALGIKTKYFIECKRYASSNKVGVEVVRALQGVKNTKDGPNKVIVATTSTFTSGAENFVRNEATSKWDMTLAGYKDIIEWLDGYP